MREGGILIKNWKYLRFQKRGNLSQCKKLTFLSCSCSVLTSLSFLYHLLLLRPLHSTAAPLISCDTFRSGGDAAAAAAAAASGTRRRLGPPKHIEIEIKREICPLHMACALPTTTTSTTPALRTSPLRCPLCNSIVGTFCATAVG